MSAQGWLKLHRKLQYSEIFRDPDLLRLWMYALMRASHCERSVSWDGETVDILPGQFITGRSALHDDYNDGLPTKNKVKDTTLWNWLKKLEKMGNLKIENAPSRRYSVVTILKWGDYQEDENIHNEEEPPPLESKNEEGSEDMSEFKEAGEQGIEEEAKVPKKVGKRVYEKTDTEYRLAGRLFYWMLKNNPNAKKPNPQKWSDTIRLMIERDDRDPEEIQSIIDWCQNDDFWMSNILSPEKLRKQYDTLFLQRKRDLEKKSKGNAGGGGKAAQKNDLLREMMDKEARKNGSSGNDQTLLPYN